MGSSAASDVRWTTSTAKPVKTAQARDFMKLLVTLHRRAPIPTLRPFRAADWRGLTRSVICPRLQGGPTRMSLLAKPFPTEMTTPINLEGNKKRSVEAHRNLFCTAYDEGRDEAAKRGGNSLTSVPCPNGRITHAGPE